MLNVRWGLFFSMTGLFIPSYQRILVKLLTVDIIQEGYAVNMYLWFAYNILMNPYITASDSRYHLDSLLCACKQILHQELLTKSWRCVWHSIFSKLL